MVAVGCLLAASVRRRLMRDAISERGGGGDRAVAETAHSRCFFFPSSGTPARVGPVPGEGSSGEAEAMMMCSAGAQAASLLPHPKEREREERKKKREKKTKRTEQEYHACVFCRVCCLVGDHGLTWDNASSAGGEDTHNASADRLSRNENHSD